MHIRKRFILPSALLAAAMAWAPLALAQAPQQAAPLQWQSAGAARYVCGGIGDDEMSTIKAWRNDANGELLFTGGPQGAYLSDVAVTIRGKSLPAPLNLTAGGPVCLLKLPKGSYVVEASYNGTALKQALRIDGTRRQTQLRWPAY